MKHLTCHDLRGLLNPSKLIGMQERAFRLPGEDSR